MIEGLSGQILVYLAAAVFLVPLFHRFGLGAILGYLIAGILVGPFGFAFVADTKDVLHFSEFGVVLFLFLIGLELNPQRLWSLRRRLVGLGGLQVLFSAGIFWAGLKLFGWSNIESLVVAMGLSLSSTAIALALLRQRNLLTTPAGQDSFSILLFQDLAVIPMLAILPLLGTPANGNSSAGFWIAIGAVLGVVVVGKLLLGPALRWIASMNMREVFTAFSLFVVLGVALLMNAVGLSMALGAFIAGVLLSDTEYRHELEINLEPFRGLLMGLFFIAIGMSIDLDMVLKDPLVIVALAAFIFIIKIPILFVLARKFGLGRSEGLRVAVFLSQGGEFAFVLFALASAQGLMSIERSAQVVAAVAISMGLTPLLISLSERFIQPRLTESFGGVLPDGPQQETNPVIVAGFGRFGQIVTRILYSQGINCTVLDHDPNHINFVKKFGWRAFYGDASRLDLLESAGIQQAKALVLAIDDEDAQTRAYEAVRKSFPHIKIFVRVRNRQGAYPYVMEDVRAFRETFGSSLEMATSVLAAMGFGNFEAHQIVKKFKYYDERMVKEQAQVAHDDQKNVQLSQQMREDLDSIMKTDRERRQSNSSEGWS